MEKERDERGRFTGDGESGKHTRFRKGNSVASKYKKEYKKKLLDYFNTPLTRVEYKECLDSKGNVDKRIPTVVANEFPTFEGFAASIGVTADTLRNWCKEHEDFGEAYEKARDMQKGRLISGAMSGLYNPQFAKFLAINNHGMADKKENDGTMNVNVELSDMMKKEAE